MSRKRVTILGMGGTISSAGVSKVDVLDYPELGKRLSAHEVVDLVPEVHDLAEISVINLRETVSTALTSTDWFQLRSQVTDTLIAGADSVVILHGTGTLEETAYFLQLTLDTLRPVVIVGSQRPITTVGSDGPANLLAAIRCAISPEASGAGVLVVLNDEIHSARHVQKVANRRLNAFESPGHGPVGYVDGDRVIWNYSIRALHTTRSLVRGVTDTGGIRVDIVDSYVGADDVQIQASLNAGAHGLVNSGIPPGSPTPIQRRLLVAAASRGVAVVQSSRALRDRVPPRQVLKEAGFVAARDLSPQKSRILLTLGLACNMGRYSELDELFETH